MTKLSLKGKRILEISGLENAHQVAMRSRVSYPSIEKYINKSGTVKYIDLSVLASLMIEGCGMTKEDFLNMKFGDIFSIED